MLLERILVGSAVTPPGGAGGLYKLEQGEGRWELDAVVSHGVSVQAITPHPTKPGIVFLATREGMYRSEDAGETFRRLDVTDEPVRFWSVTVSLRHPDVVFVGTSPVGIYRSDDTGETWEQCEADDSERYELPSTFGRSRVMRIAFDAIDPMIMYAACEINGLLLSEDGGQSWQHRDSGLLALAQQPHLKNTVATSDDTEGVFDGHSICVSPASSDSFIYVSRMGLFESADAGETFTELDVGRYAPYSYCRDCRVDPVDPSRLFACLSPDTYADTGSLYSSDDFGRSWYCVDQQVTGRSTMMAFGLHYSEPSHLVSVTRRGQVFVTTDGCRTWSEYQLPIDAGDAYCAAIL